MSDLPNLLLASLNPTSRKQAEQNLQTLSVQPSFLSVLLRLVLDQSQDRAIRLAASVYLKNVVKTRWEDVRISIKQTKHACLILMFLIQEEPPVPEADKTALRSELIPAMIALSNASSKAMRAQIAEAISLIASKDFPELWPDLMDVSCPLALCSVARGSCLCCSCRADVCMLTKAP